MNKNNRTDTVFLPIKPQYAQAIVRGEKKVEFRKKFPINVKRVIIYSSSPEKKILGWFDVDTVEVLHPQKAWELYNDVGSIDKEDFFAYYADKDTASVIKVKDVFEFSSEVPSPRELDIKIPQSFFYVTEDLWRVLWDYSNQSKKANEWIESTIGEATAVTLGQSPASDTYNEQKDGLPFYQGKTEFGSLYPTPRKWCSEPKKIASKDDVLISVRAPIGPTNICEEDSCIGRGIAAIKPLASMPTKFVLFYLRYKEQMLAALGTGTTFKAISGDNLKSFPFVVPPLPEQRAIVSKIEQLFSELDNGIDNLIIAQEQLRIYRQAVLKKAFEGELTKEWREQQTEIPFADELLIQIQVEREAYYKNQVAEWKEEVKAWEAGGKNEKKPTKPKKAKEHSELSENELSKLTILPNGWKWLQIGKSFVSFGQGWSPRCENYPSQDDEWGVIKTTAIQANHFNPDENKKLPSQLEPKKQHELQNGDILLTRAGPRVRVGVCCLVKNVRKKLINCDKAYRMRLAGLNPEYVVYMLNSPVYTKEMEKTKSGINDSGLNLKQDIFSQMPIPVPSREEQDQIVSEIESRLSVCDNVEETIKKSLQQSMSLRQSILKKAFEGKLLSDAELKQSQNESDWEPAEELLKRIQEEKQTLVNTKGSRKRIKKKVIKMELKPVIDVLKEATEPLEAKEVWQLSVFKDDIEAFYTELKRIEDQIEEIKDGSSSKLSMKK